MNNASQRQEVWSRFWQSGTLHSCAGSFGGELGPAASRFWRAVFEPLAAGARWVDLACGNGSLARAVTQWRRPLDLECHGVDLAALQPDWLRTVPADARPRLHFHGGTRLEQLPFASGSLALVCSQYGLEYAERAAACAEVRRVLRPEGRLALLMHHAESLPVRLAATELRHGEQLLADDGLLATALPMLNCVALAGTAAGRAALERDPAATRARDRFNAVQDALDGALAASDCPDLPHAVRNAVHQLLGMAASGRLAEAQQQLAQLRQSVEDNQLRLRELRSCALDAGALQDWLEALGVRERAQVTELRERNALMGWTVQT